MTEKKPQPQSLKVTFKVLALAIGLAALAGCDPQSEAVMEIGMPAVQVITVQAQPVDMTVELPGRIEPVRVAEVRARVAGIVLSRNFTEGSDVKAGQVLFQIDPAPFKAALARAKAELARADAALFDAQAVVRRYEPLVKIEAVSEQDFVTAHPEHFDAL